MTIDQIRDTIAEKLPADELWGNLLTDTNPGNYGADAWEIDLNPENIWVDIPKKTFTFKEAIFSFNVKLGSSNDEDGFESSFTKIASGEGKFEFSNGNKSVDIYDIDVKVDLDLFAEE